ncbi:MAG: hypothetical protein GF418_02400, partial [Chitinivibrionales bacterium]|nr:hypothetical protein [Chitinivibrionales bacterium]
MATDRIVKVIITLAGDRRMKTQRIIKTIVTLALTLAVFVQVGFARDHEKSVEEWIEAVKEQAREELADADLARLQHGCAVWRGKFGKHGQHYDDEPKGMTPEERRTYEEYLAWWEDRGKALLQEWLDEGALTGDEVK